MRGWGVRAGMGAAGSGIGHDDEASGWWRCVGAGCPRLSAGVGGGASRVVARGLGGLAAGISFLRFNELLTRARARLELRSQGIHVNFV